MQRELGALVENRDVRSGTRAFRFTARRQFWAILAVALLQSLLFVVIVPPWQHYDEPTHFEYAWLIAHLRRQPVSGDEDATMRREVQASMIARGHFALQPDLLETDAYRIWIGYSELGHPPGYYILAALPLALFSHLDITSQLYLVRAISVLLFLLTVLIAWRTVCELVPPDNPLRVAVPLVVALLPTFGDVMTAVNNDVGAVFALSLFTWGAVGLIVRGPSWRRVAWVFGAALLGAAVKNTAMYGLALAPVALLFALWLRKGWPLWKPVGALLVLALAMLPVLFSWGDAALWYRLDASSTQRAATRSASAAAPHGRAVFVVEAEPAAPQRQVLYPLRARDIEQIAGKTVTLGGWIWADQEAPAVQLGLGVAGPSDADFRQLNEPVAVGTEPRFVAYTLTVPEDTRRGLIVLTASMAPQQQTPIHVYFDGLVLAQGSFNTAVLPEFADAQASRGSWGGRQFSNLAGNASAESAWPRPRQAVDDTLRLLARHRISLVILSLLDIGRTGTLLAGWALPQAVDGLVDRYAWSQVRLELPGFARALQLALLLAFAGCIWLVLRRKRSGRPAVHVALAFIALLAAIAWSITVLRPLPALTAALLPPAARYTFPAIIATACVLCVGWVQPWPARMREWIAALVVLLMLVVNVAGWMTIRLYFLAA